jgi:hypothetical protein
LNLIQGSFDWHAAATKLHPQLVLRVSCIQQHHYLLCIFISKRHLQLVLRLDTDMSWLCILHKPDERHALLFCTICCYADVSWVRALDSINATHRLMCISVCSWGGLSPLKGAGIHIQSLARFEPFSRMPHCLLRVPTCSWCRGWTLT